MTASKTNRWEEIAEQKVSELTEEIKNYMSEGIAKERAIEIVKKETSIGQVYWDMVIENAG